MRKFLLATTLVLGSIGVLALSLVFIQSMAPSKKVLSERPFFDISKLEKGSYRFEYLGKEQKRKLLIIHDWDGELYTYWFPVNSGKIPMPDNNYWPAYGFYQCEDFRPDLDENNLIEKNGVISCKDESTPDWGKSSWLWTYSGERYNAEASWTPNLMNPGHESINNILYVNYK